MNIYSTQLKVNGVDDISVADAIHRLLMFQYQKARGEHAALYGKSERLKIANEEAIRKFHDDDDYGYGIGIFFQVPYSDADIAAALDAEESARIRYEHAGAMLGFVVKHFIEKAYN